MRLGCNGVPGTERVPYWSGQFSRARRRSAPTGTSTIGAPRSPHNKSTSAAVSVVDRSM